MFGYILALLLPLVLLAVVSVIKDENRGKVLGVMLAAYFTRILWEIFLSDLPIFSYGSGGDSSLYEGYAEIICQIWQHDGIHYIGMDEFQLLGRSTLPPNLFALVIYASGTEGARTGSTGIIALCACLACLNFYRLALDLGTAPKIAFRVMCVLLFMPAFFLYTSDVYKDGLVLFFVMTSFAAAIRLSRRFDPIQLVLIVVSCIGLYACRFYLIFVVVTPLFVSVMGIGGKNLARKLLGTLTLVGLFVVLFGFTNILEGAERDAESTYDQGEKNAIYNAIDVRSGNIMGSGVVFDDGGKATGALHLKLIYTLFSPFPWTSGSIALHLGKIEALVWYYFCYRAYFACKRLFREDRGLLLMFITFLIPTTITYALVMSNIGLIVRERMGVVMIGILLGTLSWAKTKGEASDQQEAISERETGAVALDSTKTAAAE